MWFVNEYNTKLRIYKINKKYGNWAKYTSSGTDNGKYYMKDTFHFNLNRSNNPLNKYYRGCHRTKSVLWKKGYSILQRKCLC